MADRFVALLRGINVGGHHKIPMADLRALCAGLGWEDVSTYIQSGNVVFEAEEEPEALEAALEGAIVSRFGFSIPVIVRTAAEWGHFTAGHPFSEAAEVDAKFVHLVSSKEPPLPDAAAQIQARGNSGERVALVEGALWIHYAGGVGRSKLTPALLDRLVGSSVTARIWRTVLKIGELLGD